MANEFNIKSGLKLNDYSFPSSIGASGQSMIVNAGGTGLEFSAISVVSGTTGTLPVFTGTSAIGDSIITQIGTTAIKLTGDSIITSQLTVGELNIDATTVFKVKGDAGINRIVEFQTSTGSNAVFVYNDGTSFLGGGVGIGNSGVAPNTDAIRISGADFNRCVVASSTRANGDVTGIYSKLSFSNSGVNIAGYFEAVNGGTGGHVALQIVDGTEGTDKVLISDANGVATWQTNTGGFTHYLGEDFGGGIIYYLYKDSSNVEHGLIVSKTESDEVWQATGTLTGADRTEDGSFNTALMTSSDAATYATGLTGGGFSDWYVPSIDELSLLWHSRFHTNAALRAGAFTLLSSTALYWSSTETTTTDAYLFRFANGYQNDFAKNSARTVRGVRSF